MSNERLNVKKGIKYLPQILLVIIYDFLRYLIPKNSYRKHRIWLYEHIYKMTSAFSAILSAFTGTVLDE